MKNQKKKTKQIRYSKIVILDTCVCRALENDNESTWYNDFLELKNHKTHFCLSDIATIELELAFIRQSISSAGWKKIIKKLRRILSPFFPIFPGGKQFFQMAGICENTKNMEKFSYLEESRYSNDQFKAIAEYNKFSDVMHSQIDLENALKQKTKQWLQLFDFQDTTINEHALEFFRKSSLEDLVITAKNEFDQNYYSVPPFSKRADLLIRYISSLQRRSLEKHEPYNPISKKKRNDGHDFAIIIPMIFPARVCTNDSLNGIRTIKSYQSDWIVSPMEIAAEYKKTKTLKKLCFQ